MCIRDSYWTQPAQLLKKAKDPTGSFMVWVQAVFDLLRLRKLPMAASESPIAYGKRLDALLSLIHISRPQPTAAAWAPSRA